VGQIRPWPPIEVGNRVWPPLGGRKSNDIIVNLSKCKDFGPPISMSVMDLPPLWENTTLKHEKRSMEKKGHQKFWEIDDIFGGNADIFSGNT